MLLPLPYEFNGKIFEPTYELNYSDPTFSYGIKVKFIEKGTNEYGCYKTYKEAVSSCLTNAKSSIVNNRNIINKCERAVEYYSRLLHQINFNETIDKEIK